jgi:hypothetical protein
MQKLNLPEYKFKIKQKGEKYEIFDKIRRKYIALTPEEWVRQNFIMYLINEKNVPESLIVIEQKLKYNKLTKRSDIVVYDNLAKPKIIVECKATNINITQHTFDQIARYNMSLKVKYLIVTNGITHYCCIIDYLNKNYSFIENIPNYSEL